MGGVLPVPHHVGAAAVCRGADAGSGAFAAGIGPAQGNPGGSGAAAAAGGYFDRVERPARGKDPGAGGLRGYDPEAGKAAPAGDGHPGGPAAGYAGLLHHLGASDQDADGGDEAVSGNGEPGASGHGGGAIPHGAVCGHGAAVPAAEQRGERPGNPGIQAG